KNRKGHFNWGEEYWVGFSINVQIPIRGYRVISQHHSTPGAGADGEADWSVSAGGNSFTIRAMDGDFVFFTATDPAQVNQGPTGSGATRGSVAVRRPYTLDQWHDIVLHFRYATDSTGIMEVWMDGDQVVNVHGPSVYKFDLAGRPKTPRQIQKIGMYHGVDEPVGEILYDAFRIGGADASYQDVAPR
ncbi:MAG: heparin lyase I family protein, partial [Granulosicoccus sp.]